MEPRERMLVFDYQVSRLVMGIIAFTLPFVVSFVSSTPLLSISASYYTGARDVFVGMLFIVGSFLFAYNGYTTTQSVTSKIASLAAILAAVCPTKCETCQWSIIAIVHYCSATTLFSVLAYFCLGPFSQKAEGKKFTHKKAKRRKIIYQLCGYSMIVCMVTAAISIGVQLFLPGNKIETLRLTYWAEAVALVAFGVAWMTASRFSQWFAEEEERLRLFKRE